jgi:hypothetical protein
MSLAALVKNRKKELKQAEVSQKPSLIARIDEYLMLQPGDDRRDGLFHPSDLSNNFCPREWCLYNWHPHGKLVHDSRWDARFKRILGNGHGLHDRVQRYFQMQDVLWGRWVRPVGYDADGQTINEEHLGWVPKLADGRIDSTWRYAEVRIRNVARNTKGHTDGVMRLKGESRLGFEYGKWGLEIKSINEQGFNWLPETQTDDGEKEAHRYQTYIYEDGLEAERALPDSESWWYGADGWEFWEQPLEGFIVLYEDKNKQQMREFVVPYDGQKIDGFFESIKDRTDAAMAFKEAKERGEEPRYPTCKCKQKGKLCVKYPLG